MRECVRASVWGELGEVMRENNLFFQWDAEYNLIPEPPSDRTVEVDVGRINKANVFIHMFRIASTSF